MRKKSPARAPEETRSNLVAAAAKLFNSVGYYGTNSNRIARQAGYAPGTFYVHFADKLEIFLEVYRGWVESEWQAIAATLEPDRRRGGESARIARIVLQHHRDWRMFRASLRALTVTEQRVHDARVAERKRQIARTAEHLRARGVTQPPARIYANLLLFEILCDAVADGDTAKLGIKESDILARLAADAEELLDLPALATTAAAAKVRPECRCLSPGRIACGATPKQCNAAAFVPDLAARLFAAIPVSGVHDRTIRDA